MMINLNRRLITFIFSIRVGINVEYFPFDEQKCTMKFSSWTYDGLQVSHDVIHSRSPFTIKLFRIGQFVEPSRRGRPLQLRAERRMGPHRPGRREECSVLFLLRR